MYGCNTNQQGYKGIQDTHLVQDGYIMRVNEIDIAVSKEPRYVYMRNRMSRDCKYDRVNVDQKCKGCKRENNLRDSSDRICKCDNPFMCF